MDLEATPPNFETVPSSPAVGTGSTILSCEFGWCDPNGSSPKSIYGSTDFLGSPRTHGSKIDIGAYENTGEAIANSLTVRLTSASYALQYGEYDHSNGIRVRHPRWRRRAERNREILARGHITVNANAPANQRHGIRGKYSAQCGKAAARGQLLNGSVLGKFDCALLSCVGTAGYYLRQRDIGHHHADAAAVRQTR